MSNKLHGIIFAYRSNPALRELTQHRNTCSVPYGGRYRIIDFMLSNPPFGTPWKTDLKAWGDIKKDDITDTRFRVNYKGEDFSLIPDISDPQMLFLANNISKMKRDTVLGSRIVEVHNGSSLFTGKAGQGPSNLRQYILEQDLLEAIVAVPEKMFYNTPISTYIWILANKKEERRKGKVQLIDATSFKKPLRKNLGEKNGGRNCGQQEYVRASEA